MFITKFFTSLISYAAALCIAASKGIFGLLILLL